MVRGAAIILGSAFGGALATGAIVQVALLGRLGGAEDLLIGAFGPLILTLPLASIVVGLIDRVERRTQSRSKGALAAVCGGSAAGALALTAFFRMIDLAPLGASAGATTALFVVAIAAVWRQEARR